MRHRILVFFLVVMLSIAHAEESSIFYRPLTAENILAIKRCDKLISQEFFLDYYQ